MIFYLQHLIISIWTTILQFLFFIFKSWKPNGGICCDVVLNSTQSSHPDCVIWRATWMTFFFLPDLGLTDLNRCRGILGFQPVLLSRVYWDSHCDDLIFFTRSGTNQPESWIIIGVFWGFNPRFGVGYIFAGF